MTSQPETRFKCDRCPTEVSVVVQNTPNRMLPPDDWLTMRFNEDTAAPATHLCPVCAMVFWNYMKQIT